jgi:hypothetical protein
MKTAIFIVTAVRTSDHFYIQLHNDVSVLQLEIHILPHLESNINANCQELNFFACFKAAPFTLRDANQSREAKSLTVLHWTAYKLYRFWKTRRGPLCACNTVRTLAELRRTSAYNHSRIGTTVQNLAGGVRKCLYMYILNNKHQVLRPESGVMQE